MNRWQLFYEKWIVRFLVKEPLKHGSYFLSHGFFHFVMCILVGVVTALWWHKNVSSSDTIMHDITLEFKQPQSPYSYKDTITSLSIDFIIDSDSLLKKTNNKYRSMINVVYNYDYSNRDSLDKDKPKDPTVITLHSEPYLDDLYVDQDSIFVKSSTITEETDSGEFTIPKLIETKFETYLTQKTLSDSAIEISVISAKNQPLPMRDSLIEGMQSINFYSNKLGRANNDSYYNYYIDFDFLPLVKDTQKSHGFYNISIQIGDVTSNRGFHHVGNKKLLYQYIYPQPDIFTNGYLFYYTDEAVNKVAKNHCILIQATDIEAMNRNNRKAIIYSVLVGTGAALFFDILIQLVRELRNVNRKKEEEEAEQKEENNKQTDCGCDDKMSVVEDFDSNNDATEVKDNEIVSDNTIIEENDMEIK